MSGPPTARNGDWPRHRVSPHPRAFYVLTCMLAGAAGIALLGLGFLFVEAPPFVAQERASDLVRRFYAETNHVLAGGSPAGLERVVAANLINHHASVSTSGREVLMRRLTELRRAAPAAQLRVSAIATEGEWAAAQVTTVGLRPMVLGTPLELASEQPAQIEFFRILDRRLVEYWPGEPASLPQVLPPFAVAPWVTDTTVSLARLTFPARAKLSDLTAPGEHLMVLESGELEVSLSGSAMLLVAARPGAGWQATPASGQQLVLRAGDAVLVPSTTRHTITNSRASSATVLGVAMFPAAALAAPGRRDDAGDARLTAIYDPTRVGTRTTWERQVRVDGLAAGVGEARSGPCVAVARTVVTVTHFTLGPGAGLPAHDVEGIELLAITSGGLEVEATDLIGVATPAAVPANGGLSISATARRTGHGLFLSSGPAPSIRNVGPLPLPLVAIALQPAAGTSCAVSPIET